MVQKLPKPPLTWKSTEREVAEMWGDENNKCTRNPLSGSNNRDDKGEKRIADIIGLNNIVVEVKYRKRISTILRALATQKQVKEFNEKHNTDKIWVHMERTKGNAKLWTLTVDKTILLEIINFLKGKYENKKESS